MIRDVLIVAGIVFLFTWAYFLGEGLRMASHWLGLF